MATTLAFSELNAWLGNQAENTKDTPYEIVITGVTDSDLVGLNDDFEYIEGSLGYIIRTNNTKYVNIVGLKGVVTSIGYGAFKDCTTLTSITIPNNVTSINEHSFRGCTSLTSINIPDGVTSIGEGAFRGCDSLTSINIPDGVTSIGEGAFSGCTSLTEITIPDSVTSIGIIAFYGCSLTSITIPDSVTSIRSRAFMGCTSLTNATIGNGVTSIGNYAFMGCTSLTNATIGNGVTSIGNDAFSGCGSLTSINIPDSVTSIGNDAFFECTSLTNVTIGNNVTSIGKGAFRGCSSLTSITIPDGVTTIGSSAFYDCSSLTSINIPDGVTSIGEGAFRGCDSLTSINIPDGVTSIGEGAFRGCTSLTNATIGNGVTYIGYNAFYGCSLTSITIPNTVKTIGTDVFTNCPIETVTIGKIIETKTLGDIGIDTSNITDITVLDGVSGLVDFAFYSSYNLLNVTLPEGLETIGASAFRKCMPLPTITIPSTVTTIGSEAFHDCTSMDPITILGNTEFANDSLIGLTLNVKVNPEVWTQGYTSSLGGGAVIFYDLDGNLLSPITPSTLDTFLYLAPINSADTPYEITLTNVTNTDLVGNATTPVHIQKAIKDNSTKYLKIVGIEGEVTTIGEAAFAGCTNLLGLEIPNTITTIGEGAFCETGMESIIIPGSVTSMDCYYLFADCLSLKNVTFNNGEISPTRTEGMFQNDTELDTINLIWLNTENLTDTSKYENMFAGITADVYVNNYIWGLGTDDTTFGGATAITWHKITLELDIVDGIENEDVYYGIVKTLRVNAIANLPSTTITYKWYKNNLLMETVTGNSYTYVVLEDGTYKCEVTATLGDDTVTKYTEGTIKAVPYYEEGTKVIVHGSQTIRSDLYVHGEIKGTFMDSIIARIEALENRD